LKFFKIFKFKIFQFSNPKAFQNTSNFEKINKFFKYIFISLCFTKKLLRSWFTYSQSSDMEKLQLEESKKGRNVERGRHSRLHPQKKLHTLIFIFFHFPFITTFHSIKLFWAFRSFIKNSFQIDLRNNF